MSTFTKTIDIDARSDAAWNTLADIGTIAEWKADLMASNATNDGVGIGGTRHCAISSTVTASPLNTMKYGLLGNLLDRLFVGGMYDKGMSGLPDGLRTHVKTQDVVTKRTGKTPEIQGAASEGVRS